MGNGDADGEGEESGEPYEPIDRGDAIEHRGKSVRLCGRCMASVKSEEESWGLVGDTPHSKSDASRLSTALRSKVSGFDGIV